MMNYDGHYKLSRREILRRSAVVAVLASSSSAVAACGSDSRAIEGAPASGSSNPESPPGAGPDTLAQAQDQGFIRVGFANEPPWGYSEAGKLTGEAPEIARAVLADLGVAELDGVLTEFGSLIPGLQAGRFDIIAAGLFVLPERCQEVLFTDPTYCSTTTFLVEAGNPLGVKDHRDLLTNPDIKVGIVAGSSEEAFLQSVGLPEAQIVRLSGALPDFIEALRAARIDVLPSTTVTARSFLDESQATDIEATEPFIPEVDGEPQLGCGAFAFRRDDQEFRDAFNDVLRGLIDDSTTHELTEQFGYDTEGIQQAADLTTEDLCNPSGER